MTFAGRPTDLLRWLRPLPAHGSREKRVWIRYNGKQEKRILQFTVDSLWTGNENASGGYKDKGEGRSSDSFGSFQNFGELSFAQQFPSPGTVSLGVASGHAPTDKNQVPFQIDGNYGITAGMAEMFLPSQSGAIELLPALPKSYPAGTAKGLRARGEVIVDQTWKDGKLVAARLTSPIAQEVSVLAPGDTQPRKVTLAPGQPVTLKP